MPGKTNINSVSSMEALVFVKSFTYKSHYPVPFRNLIVTELLVLDKRTDRLTIEKLHK